MPQEWDEQGRPVAQQRWDETGKPVTLPAAPTQAPAIGVSAPSPTIAERVGAHIPDVAMPVLSAAQKYLITPFERMSQYGADVAGQAARFPSQMLTATEQLPQTLRGMSPYGPVPAQTAPLEEATKLAHPVTSGAASAVGEIAGGMAADPRMWALSLGTVGGAAVRRLISGGFSAQQIYGAATTVPEVSDAIKRGDWYEASRLITHTTASALMGLAAGTHSLFGEPKPTKPEESKPISVPATNDPKIFPSPRPAGLATGGTIGMDRLDPKDLVAPAAKATTVDRQKMADQRASASIPVTSSSGRSVDPVDLSIGTNNRTGVGEVREEYTGKDDNNRIWRMTPEEQAEFDHSLTLPNRERYEAQKALKQKISLRAHDAERNWVPNPNAKVWEPDGEWQDIDVSPLPETKYRETEKAALMSAPTKDLGPDFKINEWKHEIDRNQSVINNPAATLEERQIASDRLRDAKEGIAAVSTPPTPGMVQSLLTGQMEPAMTELRLLREEVAKRDAEEAAKPVDLAPKPKDVSTTAPDPPGSAVDYNPPEPLVNNMETLLDLRKQAAKKTNTPEESAYINSRIVEVSAEARQQLRNHLSRLSPRQLDQWQVELKGNGKLQKERSVFIKDRVAENERIKIANQPFKDLQATGGPGRPGIDPETGAHKGVVIPSELGLPGRQLLREVQGKERLVDPSKFIFHPKPEGMKAEDFKDWTTKQKVRASQLRAQFIDAYKAVRDSSTRVNTVTPEDELAGGKVETAFALLKEYDDTVNQLGKYPDELSGIGRRKGLGGRAKLTAEPAPGKEIGIEEARRMMGKPVNRIPSNEEFLAHADGLAERARLNEMLSDVIDKEKDRRAGKYVPPTRKGPVRPLDDPSQRGTLGEVATLEPPTQPLEIPSEKELLDNARKFGMRVIDMKSADGPSAYKVMVSPSGKYAVDMGMLSHVDGAQQMLGDNTRPALSAMIQNGWMRGATLRAWEIDKPLESTLQALQDHLERTGQFGKDIQIEFHGERDPRSGSTSQTVNVDRGWENLIPAFRRAQREAALAQRGASGVSLATGMGVGGALGYAAGHALGIPPEMTGSFGMLAGMLTPHVFEHLRPELSKIAPLLKNTGISMRDWLRGPDQKPIDDPMMEDIINQQRNSPDGMAARLVNRLTQLPPELQRRIFDKFSTINDQAGPWQRLIGQLDPVNKVFNKLKISENDSAYVAARMAEGGSSGRIEIRRAIYKNVIDEAQKLGLTNLLTKYLNLTNYRRVYQVLREHANNLDMQEQNLRTKLESPSLTTRQQVALENDLADTVKAKADLNERIKSGQVVPVYNEALVNSSLNFFKRDTDPQDFAKVHELATKVWQSNRDILDLAHNGKDHIIPDSEYKTYVDRGIEYTPMKRIMESIVDHPANSGDHNAAISPLYLRHQNIIKALEGSARVNVDPITASANAAFHSIREIRRNQVINKLIDEAEQDPNGVGNLFKQVPSGYKPGPNEALVGGYRGDGQQVTYAVPRALGETLKVASPAALNTAFGAMSRFSAKQFRTGVTIGNVAFAVFSIPRHTMRQLALSKVGANVFNVPEFAGWIRDYTKALGSTIVKGEWYREALKNDALDGTLQRAITPEKDMVPGKGPRRTTIESIEEFNKRWDSITKTMTYNRMIEAGHTPVEAAWEARRYGGAPDYAHMGTDMPALNLVEMFLNANIQYRSSFLAALSDKERLPHLAGFLAASTIGVLAAWEYNHTQRDKDGNLLWNKVPYNDRERYFCILTGTKQDQHTGATTPTYFRVPKSFEAQAVINPMEDMLYKMSKSDDRSMKQIGLNNFQNWLPGEFDLQEGQIGRSVGYGLLNTMNPIIRVPLGEYANVDPAFGGRPIVPKREEDIEASLQGGAATPDIYKRMGQGGVPGAIAGGTAGGTMGAMWGGRVGALVGGGLGAAIGAYGVSPRRLEYGVQGMTGGVGQMTARLADRMTGSQSTFPYRGQEATKQIPVAGQVAGRFMGSGADQTFLNESRKFYEEYGQQLSTIKNSMNFIKKNQPEQAADYAQQHAQEIHMAKLYDASAQKVNKINVKIQQIQSMMEQKQIDEGPGFEALQTLFEAKTQIMKAFNGAADSVLKTPPASPSRQEGWSR